MLHGCIRLLRFIQGTTYLDHAGTTPYSKSLMDAFTKDMTTSLFGNPHSASASSQLASRRIDDVRLQVLRLFNADPDHFDLVFVANATAGIKLVMEGFREVEGGFWFGYHKDSHTSLVGVREAAAAGHHCFGSDEEVEDWIDGNDDVCKSLNNTKLGLFAYAAQSNMNGRRLPLSWTGRLKRSKYREKLYSLLDVAALVSTSPFSLINHSSAPDFTVLSFYKMFGFPDLGAVIVRKASGAVLEKRRYFGGGTVEMVVGGKENWHIRKHGSLHERLEDGTLPVHSIIALDNAMETHQRHFGSFKHVTSHTSNLTGLLYEKLSSLRHYNNVEVCEIYKDPSSFYKDPRTQGPIIAFNLRNSQEEWISNAEVEKLASLRKIELRSGGLCNPGGVASALNLQPWETRRNYSAGHRCGNENDIIGGKPTGVIRVSLGAMSCLRDISTFHEFIEEFFVDHEPIQSRLVGADLGERELSVESLTIYPIKSCGGWPIPPNVMWDVREEGLMWDREWCLVHGGTKTALSQKKHPRMAMIRPNLDLSNGLLHISYYGSIPPSMPNEISVPLSADPKVFQKLADGFPRPCSQVCGDDIVAHTYASKEIADFFTSIVGTPCTLARFPAAISGLSTRHSKAHLKPSRKQSESGFSPKSQPRPIFLSNESPILTISRSSLNRLNEQIKCKGGKAADATVFRANIVVAENPAVPPGSEQPYVEDDWQSLHIGQQVTLDVLGGCRRCQMICVDQHNAEKNEEPFVTLAKTRRKEGKVFFGVHTALANNQRGQVARINVGDKVVASKVGDE